MLPAYIVALLTDQSGRYLLVRRRESLLWSFPGGPVLAAADPLPEYLGTLCRRQIGLTPEFPAPLTMLPFAGDFYAIGRCEIPVDRPRACGRVTTTRWVHPSDLPQDITPLTRIAMAWSADHRDESPTIELELATA